jgi:hypothetical protein
MTAATPLLPLYAFWRAHEQLYRTQQCLPVLTERTGIRCHSNSTAIFNAMLTVVLRKIERRSCLPSEQLC